MLRLDDNIISKLCKKCFSEIPQSIERCSVGQGNYVFIVQLTDTTYVIRCSPEKNAYNDTVYWLEKLAFIEIPIPKIVAKGVFEDTEYIILTYFEGKDIGLVYSLLSDEDKRTIASEIVCIQERVAALELEDIPSEWTWHSEINYMLDRAEERIAANEYFDIEKVDRLRKSAIALDKYFDRIEPIAYLDDVSTKNLLIHDGHISGIVDIDWIGIGDSLTYVALTNIALLNMGYDTDYVKYILKEMNLSSIQKKAFLFYSLMYCVDFMGERGMHFTDKYIEVNEQIIDRLNSIYDLLWKEFEEHSH
ncbi:Phosphotransferase enzyme family protein [Ruminococcus albus]|uniref:Phosphotransferase enzyme family protein n=1 Tax=Ruminococcus albus TaxID=1264 RepID=A0A1H7GXG7_RUMAL|nr:Phosphotransferase enzyme family protein [Ruminococcus albus]